MKKPDLFIIKIGGKVIDNKIALQKFIQDFVAIKSPKILIHGGGKTATDIGNKLNIVAQYEKGRRVTNEATLDLVTMVYAGLINKQIVAQLQAQKCNAIGLTGADANLIPAKKRSPDPIDYGFVGDPIKTATNTNFLNYLLDQKMVPVIAPITHNQEGVLLNTNADTIASQLAITLYPFFSVRLIYCFEKKGVLENMENENSVIKFINRKNYVTLLNEKKIADGILPKLENAFAAIQNGVQEVLIGDANDVLINTTNDCLGTLIQE